MWWCTEFCFADDSQLYFVIRRSEAITSTICNIENCVGTIQAWMKCNLLKLNEGKTEVIFFAARSKQCHITNLTLQFGDSTIHTTDKVKNLGCWWNTLMSMDTHVNAVAKGCFFQLRKIGHIRRHLNEDSVKTLVQSLVVSKMDYDNALLAGAKKETIKVFTKVQNRAAQIVARVQRTSHVTHILFKYHWLPVPHRINYKVLLLTYKSLQELAPGYIKELLEVYEPRPGMRSLTQQCRLVVPIPKTATYGKKTFKNVAPVLWNELDQFVKESPTLSVFKSRLKTFLCRIAYNC